MCCFESTRCNRFLIFLCKEFEVMGVFYVGLFAVRDRLDFPSVHCVGLHGEGRDTCCADFTLPSSGSFLGGPSRWKLGGAYSLRILCKEGCRSKGRRTVQRPPRLSNRTKSSWIAMMTMPLKTGDDCCLHRKVIGAGVLGLLLRKYV